MSLCLILLLGLRIHLHPGVHNQTNPHTQRKHYTHSALWRRKKGSPNQPWHVIFPTWMTEVLTCGSLWIRSSCRFVLILLLISFTYCIKPFSCRFLWSRRGLLMRGFSVPCSSAGKQNIKTNLDRLLIWHVSKAGIFLKTDFEESVWDSWSTVWFNSMPAASYKSLLCFRNKSLSTCSEFLK